MRNKLMRYSIKSTAMTALTTLMLMSAGCTEANSAEQIKAPNVVAEEGKGEIKSVAAAVVAAPTKMNWDIQAEGSHIRFSAKQEGEEFTGGFSEFSGRILFDPAAPETSSVDISIPLNSVDAGSRDRNSTLPGKVWFSSKKFPIARFTSSDISKQDTGYLAKGELTLKGKSVPLELSFELQIDANRAVMTGTVDIDRTLWNVGASPWDTDEWVSRAVKLDLQVTANRTQ